MTQWEYLILDDTQITENELDRLGSNGWEAVCGLHQYRLLLKRPRDDRMGMPTIPEPHDPKPPGPN